MKGLVTNHHRNFEKIPPESGRTAAPWRARKQGGERNPRFASPIASCSPGTEERVLAAADPCNAPKRHAPFSRNAAFFQALGTELLTPPDPVTRGLATAI